MERIIYANEETGYTVARVDTGRGANDLLTNQLLRLLRTDADKMLAFGSRSETPVDWTKAPSWLAGR